MAKKRKRPMRRKWERKKKGKGYNESITKNYSRVEPRHDFLKYIRVARNWIKKNHNITLPELEMLLYLYSENLFTRSQFYEYAKIFTWNKKWLKELEAKGWIIQWRKANTYKAQPALYTLSRNCKLMISDFYKKLAWERIYAETSQNNVIFKKTPSFTDKVHKRAILNVNEEIRERLQRPSQE
jgi:hypothetical protein